MTGLLLLTLLVYMALTFLGSTLTRSALAAAAIGVGGLVVLAILSALPTIGPYMPGGPSTPALGLAVGTDPGRCSARCWSTWALLAGLALASWVAFRHQEL